MHPSLPSSSPPSSPPPFLGEERESPVCLDPNKKLTLPFPFLRTSFLLGGNETRRSYDGNLAVEGVARARRGLDARVPWMEAEGERRGRVSVEIEIAEGVLLPKGLTRRGEVVFLRGKRERKRKEDRIGRKGGLWARTNKRNV